MNKGVSTTIVALMLVVIVALAAVAAYGWLRPIEVPTVEAVTLEEKAQKEGSVTIYGVMDTPDVVSKIIPRFELEYPWAKGKVNYIGFAPGEESTRFLSEYQAGKVQADVVVCTMGSLMPALLGGASEVWNNPMIELMQYPEGTYDPQGVWQIGFNLPIVLNYNTELVTDPATIPKSWEDLADPRWKGKIALDDPKTNDVAGTLFAHMYPIWGEAKWTEVMQGIAANNIIRTESAGEAYTKVAQGEAAVAVGLINDYLTGLATPGIRVAIDWLEPAVALPVPACLAKGAPHPNFGKLFLMWFASASGQYAIANSGRVPSHLPTAQATVLKAAAIPQGITFVLAATNNPDFYANPTKWSDKFASIYG